MSDTPDDKNHIETFRRHMLDQMKALRAAKSDEDVRREIERTKAVADLAQAVVNTAKVEVDYLKLTNQVSTPFLEVPPTPGFEGVGSGTHNKQSLPAPGPGYTGVTRHTLKG